MLLILKLVWTLSETGRDVALRLLIRDQPLDSVGDSLRRMPQVMNNLVREYAIVLDVF